MRESKLEHVKKTERVTLKHLRSKKEYDSSTRVSARVVLKEFFSRFFLFSIGSRWEINLHISLAVSLLSESSRSQIDLNERESVFQSTNHERASSGYSFERIKTGFRDEKSALNSPSEFDDGERSKEIGGKEFGILRAGLYPRKRVSHTK